MFLGLLITSLLASFISFVGLLFLRSNLNKKLKIFYAPSGKSVSNALLLGGLPFIIGLYSGMTILLLKKDHSTFIDKIILEWMILSSIFTVCGWIDDKWEIRARTKLCFQTSAVCIFAWSVTTLTASPLPAFFIISYLGMTFVNGANLLDGLDTMAIKINSSIFISFLLIGFMNNSNWLIALSFLGLLTLWSFYPFNKYPSSVHLGETGSSFLGFFSLLLTVIAFFEPATTHSVNFTYALIPPCLFFIELSLSFLRRILNGKSPFKGDRLHLHHILRTQYYLSAETTSSIISGINLLVTVGSIRLSILYQDTIGLIAQFVLLSVIYICTCLHAWRRAHVAEQSMLFAGFAQQKIVVLDVKKFDNVVSEDLFEQKSYYKKAS